MSGYINGPERPERLIGALHDRPENSEEYAPGLWRPAVPLPFYGFLHVRCRCGARFWKWRRRTRLFGPASERYERHYRAEHMPAGREDSDV